MNTDNDHTAEESEGQDKRKKKDYADHPDGKKPRLIGLTEVVDDILIADAKKHGRDLKPHCEHILEQYALGNVKIKAQGSKRWMSADIRRQDHHQAIPGQ